MELVVDTRNVIDYKHCSATVLFYQQVMPKMTTRNDSGLRLAMVSL